MVLSVDYPFVLAFQNDLYPDTVSAGSVERVQLDAAVLPQGELKNVGEVLDFLTLRVSEMKLVHVSLDWTSRGSF